jgi:hypothetical protein
MKMSEFWHVYGGPVEGMWATMIIGPTPKEAQKDLVLPYGDDGLVYQKSFDHEPIDAELDGLIPATFSR